MILTCKSQNIRQQNRKVTETLGVYLKKSGMVKHYSVQNDKIVSGMADEGFSDDDPLTSKLKRSQNIRLLKGKASEVCKESLKKSVGTEHFSDQDDKTAPREGVEDDTENETLMASLLKSQNIKLQKRKVAEVCNEPVKESGIVDHYRDKDGKTLPVVGVEDDSDDELLITKLVRSSNMRAPKGKMAEAYNKPVKDNMTAPREAVEEYTENETLLTHLLKKMERALERSKDCNTENNEPVDNQPDNEAAKDLQQMGRLKKCLSTESGQAGGVMIADQSLVDLSDNLKESLSRGKDNDSLVNEKVITEMLEYSNLLEKNMEEDNLEEKLSEGKDNELVNEEVGTEMLEDTILLEGDLLEDILEENLSEGKDNDSLVNEEAGTAMLENTNLLEDDIEEDNLEENLSKSKDNDSLVNGEADTEMLEDGSSSRRGRRSVNMTIEDDD